MAPNFGDRPFIMGGIDYSKPWDDEVDNGQPPVPPMMPEEQGEPNQPQLQGTGFMQLLQDALAKSYPQFDTSKGGGELGGAGSVHGGQNIGFNPVQMFQQQGYQFQPLD